jgi:hypothetical protein
MAVSFLYATTGRNAGLRLSNGKNEVTVSVVNACDKDLKGLTLEVAKESLPKWLEIEETVKLINLPKSTSNSKSFILTFTLNNAQEGEVAELPLILKDRNGNCWTFNVRINVSSGSATLPKAFSLSQNSPNPFNPSTTINYTVSEGEKVRVTIKIFDIRGKQIRTLVDEVKESGTYSVFWDGTDEKGSRISSGVYFYRMVAGEFDQIRKMVHLK